MADGPESTTPPVGLVRRMTGYLLAGLGIALLINESLLFAKFGPPYLREGWVFLSAVILLGTTIALVGNRLVHRTEAAWWLAAGAATLFLVNVFAVIGILEFT